MVKGVCGYRLDSTFIASVSFCLVLCILFFLFGRKIYAVVYQVCNSYRNLFPFQVEISIVFGMFLVLELGSDTFGIVPFVNTINTTVTTCAVFVFKEDCKSFCGRIFLILFNDTELPVCRLTATF